MAVQDGPGTAVVLAAGRGTRLGDLTQDTPKCLLPIRGEPLLAHQVRALRGAGVRDIVLVVGFEALPLCQRARALDPDVRWHFVVAPEFASSNTLWSLAQASRFLEDGALVVNGDVLFGAELVRHLLRHAGPAGLAIEVGKTGEEEVKVRIDAHDHVVEISKEVRPDHALGESVGVGFFSSTWGRALAEQLREMATVEAHRHAYYERAIQALLPRCPLRAVRLADHPVVEIDFLEDYARANQQIAPQLEASCG
mgnify:CR=1 FL=1